MQIIKEGNPNISCKCPECGCEFTFLKTEGERTARSDGMEIYDCFTVKCPQQGCGVKIEKFLIFA